MTRVGAALDLAVGFLLIGLGLVAWQRRGSSAVGPLMAASGFAWFLGNLASWALYLHRGPLVHLVVSYPTGRLRSRLQWAVVAAGYVCAAASPLARNDAVTILLALAVCATALRRYLVASGPERRARASALGAAVMVALALMLGAAARLAGVDTDRAVLWAYEVVIGLAAVWLFADLLWGRWTQAAITGLVVDLGELGDAGTLRDRLARALGDPSLVVGYWLPGESRYVDEAGRPVELPIAGAERAVTPIEQDGEPVAALVHDASVLGDPRLVADVAATARLAVANARLQAEVRSRVAEVAASRRRIVEAADAQRRGLERRLRRGAEQRLGRVAELISDPGPPLAEVAVGLEAARAELREFARGVHPAALVEGGLAAALAELAERSPSRSRSRRRPSGCQRWWRRPPTLSARKRSPTSPSTPRPPTRRSGWGPATVSWRSRSATTAPAGPTQQAARVCAALSTGSRRSAAGSGSTAHRAAGLDSLPSCRLPRRPGPARWPRRRREPRPEPGHGRHLSGPHRGRALSGGGQRLLKERDDGVLLIRCQGLTRTGPGETAPSTGVRVSVSRYRLQPNTKTSPGLLPGLSETLSGMPPPSVNLHSTWFPLTANVP